MILSSTGFYLKSKGLIILSNVTFSNISFTGNINSRFLSSISNDDDRILSNSDSSITSYLQFEDCKIVII